MLFKSKEQEVLESLVGKWKSKFKQENFPFYLPEDYRSAERKYIELKVKEFYTDEALKYHEIKGGVNDDR